MNIMKSRLGLLTWVSLLLLLSMACISMPLLSPPERNQDSQETVVLVATPTAAQMEDDTATPVVPTAGLAAVAESFQETLTQLYRKANPSVVYIVVTSGDSNTFLPLDSSGSGFVYGTSDQGGYIVTNNHVVEAGRGYEIVFSSGDRQRAQLIGSDVDSDLAVLRVDSLPAAAVPLPLGDGENIEVGQLTIAIGSPFGEQGSMSLGIISGLGRSLPSQRATETGATYSLPQVIQTDAPINPGNSGGPLLNLAGEVIGVNAAIASATRSNSGVGFSIPVDVVKRVVPSLIEDGEVAYPYMGVVFDGEVSLEEQELYGVPQTRGAYVIGVASGGPGDQAGLIAADPDTGRGGDLIVQINGQPIDNFSDLNTYLVFDAEVGETIELTVLRGDQAVVVPLTLGARP